MDVPGEAIQLGHNAVAIGIDKGKNSQQAVRWAIDNFGKGKNPMTIVLVHVNTHNFNPQSDGATSTVPTESEVQQLFLPYRGFCSRKGIDAVEVVLHDIDVSSALISYIDSNGIGNIVVGASNRNAITRRFKAADVPTTLEKSAPDFCAVYVIYKGKVQTMRASNVCLMPSAGGATPSSKSSVSGTSSYWTSNTKSSFGGSSIASGSSQYSSPNNSNPRMPMGGEMPARYVPNRRSSDSYGSNNSNPRISMGESVGYSPYNGRSFEGNYSNPNSQMSESSGYYPYSRSPEGGNYSNQHLSPNNSPYNCRSPEGGNYSNPHLSPNNSPYNCRSPEGGNYSNPQSSPNNSPYNRRSPESYTSFSPSRLPVSRQPPAHPHSNTGSEYNSRNYSQESWRTENSGTYSPSKDGSIPGRYNQRQHSPYGGSNPNSYQSASGISIDEQNSLTNSHCSITDELEAEIVKLKIDIKKTMDLYKSICEQASVAKQQSDSLQVGEDDDIEEIKLAREAAMVVADLERLKCQAAMDAAEMSEKLVEMEDRKRQLAEERAARREEEEKRGRKPIPVSYRLYTLEDIEVATDYFSNSLKIGEGGYGPVYKAMLQHTPVAIKVLGPNATQGLQQFQQEIDVLGRMRHPNMVLLVGACPEYGCLVYEYMENGSLEDRLFLKNNTRPIPWKTRFKIAAEIATALLFLHDAKPDPMVHRDLKPANILLDANYTSKIADVGLARLVPPAKANQVTQYHMTAAAGTFCYIDPEYQQTGQLGTKSDIYSLGVILLQLITAKSPMALSYHVEEAIDGGTFNKMLDPRIQDWPYEIALSLAQLALKCCEIRKKDRPDLNEVILPELIRLRDLALRS